MFKKIILGLFITITLQADHIKVFFSSEFKDELSAVQPYKKWHKSSTNNIYSLEELYNDGWKINNVLKTNASAREWQVIFFMEITDKKYEKVKFKYKIKKDKKIKINKNVSTSEGL